MADPLSIGDVVQLKSGGPIMTVVYVDSDGNIDCVWFDNTEKKTGSFPGAAVEATNS